MNKLLELNGVFTHKKNPSRPGDPVLPPDVSVSSVKLEKLASDLERADTFCGRRRFYGHRHSSERGNEGSSGHTL